MPFDLLISGGVILTMEPAACHSRAPIGIQTADRGYLEGEGGEKDTRVFLDARE